MKKEEEIVYGILSFLALPFLLISNIWVTYIYWDICTLYGLTFLTQCGYKTFFGVILLLGILKGILKTSKSPKTSKETFTEIIGGQIGIFLIWGVAYLLHWLMRF